MEKGRPDIRRIFFRVCGLLCLLCLVSPLLATPTKVNTVVIDAGHGGSDAGAVGRKHYEKTITLAVALQLGKMIGEQFPDVKVHYTRSQDEFIPVWQRPKIANKHKADLFISIHCNSSENSKLLPKGNETYVMGLHKSAENLAVAQKENASILQEKDYIETYDGFDPNSTEAYIIFSLFQNAHLDHSLTFANRLQTQYREHIGTVDRGVKQAGFLVLHGAAMPCVLTEVGFINNPAEEDFMASAEGQQKICTALFNAFKEYKYQIEGFNNQSESAKTPPTPKPVAAAKELPAVSENTDKLRADSSDKVSVFAETPVKQQSPDERLALDRSLPRIVYKVQFASSSTDKPLTDPEFKGIPLPGRYYHQGSYKYTAGESPTMDEISSVLRRVQNLGFRDAFIVVFKDQERISTSEALRILQENKTEAP